MDIRITLKDGVAEAHAECRNCGCSASARAVEQPAPSANRYGRIARAIVGLLARSPGLSAPAIAARLDMNRDSVRQTLARLRRDGSVVRRGRLWLAASQGPEPAEGMT